MKRRNKNTEAFLELVRAGLFPVNGEGFMVLGQAKRQSRAKDYHAVDWDEVYRLAEEQSVVGLVAAGIEALNVTVPQTVKLQFVGATLQMEQRNKEMNKFIGMLIRQLRSASVYSLLVKGQGIAQCYDKPLWRACGDVDLLLDSENYQRAKDFLLHYAASVEDENKHKHLGMVVDGWTVELHGTLRSGSMKRMDAVVDKVQEETFKEREVRVWQDGETEVHLPEPNNDVIFVFTHIVKHFFHEGIGLRQVCDWCRMLWTYREVLDYKMLESRIREAGIMSEWRVFAAFAVQYLGMPVEALPTFGSRLSDKAERLLDFFLMTGNFGHNRDLSYYKNQARLKQKAKSFSRHTRDAIRRFRIFPKDTIMVWSRMLVGGIKAL